MTRIVHIHPTHGYGPDTGGAEVVLQSLAGMAVDAGIEVTVYSRLLDPPLDLSQRKEFEPVPGITVVETPAASVEWMLKSQAGCLSSGLSEAASVEETAHRLSDFFEHEFRILGDVAA